VAEYDVLIQPNVEKLRELIFHNLTYFKESSKILIRLAFINGSERARYE
jgi:hypothetical protein